VLRRNQKVELIKRAPLFAGLSKRELEEIAGIADEIDLREGKELTTQGKINELGDGDFFGEIALVSHSPRTATVTATAPIRALVITDRSFRRLLEDSPEIQLKVLEALAERLAPNVI